MKALYKHIILIICVFLSFFSIIPGLCQAIEIPARPSAHVVDLANVIDPATETKLNGYLRELEQKTTAQVVVLTIKSLEGESIEDFAITVANDKWKIGQKGKDNGLLLLVAMKERKYRIEVGYGFEGVFPDSLAGSIGRDYLVPNFRAGKYSKGIFDATLAIINDIAKDSGVNITGMSQIVRPAYPAEKAQEPSLLSKIIGGIVFIFLLILFIRHPSLFLLLLLSSGSGGRGGSWGGGGFSGGGGGFGGGGASGGW